MKKEMLGIFGILLFVSLGFVSAGWFDFLKPTGNVIANSSLIQVSMAIGQVYTLSNGKTILVTDIFSDKVELMIEGQSVIMKKDQIQTIYGIDIRLESIAYHDNAPETSKVTININVVNSELEDNFSEIQKVNELKSSLLSSGSCSQADGLIGEVPDKYMNDNGGSAPDDSLQIYCRNHMIRICLSNEICPWRNSISSDDTDSCVGNYSKDGYVIASIYGQNGASNLDIYCNKNSNSSTSWSLVQGNYFSTQENQTYNQVSMAIGQVYTLSSGKTITVTDINSNSLIFMMIPGEHEIIRLGETRELNGVTIKLESIAYHDNAPETSKVLIEILSSNVLNQSQQTQNNSFPQQNVSNSTQQIVVPALNSCSLGFRVNQTYCSVDGSFISQKATDSSCDNNFECQSNLCINSKCISGSLLDKILSWFKNIFG